MKFVFSHKFRTAMLVRGLTGAALAELAEVNPGVITSALRGQPVTLKSATRISRALAGVPAVALMDDLKSEEDERASAASS